ncbi:MAG: cysteinyl-tRNA synthetase, partial [Myxococcota bacterium]
NFDASSSAAVLEFMLGPVQQIFGALAVTDSSDANGISDADVDALISQRSAARANKDWDLADDVRDKLVAAGIIVEDTADGIKWHRA